MSSETKVLYVKEMPTAQSEDPAEYVTGNFGTPNRM